MKKKALAFDFGASSGRAILGSFDGERIHLEEIHRFDNNPVILRGTHYWDVLNLFAEILTGLRKAAQTGAFESVGIDTWGVDFGLLDQNDSLLQNPVHYRDLRTKGLIPIAEAALSEKSLYQRTGIQLMELNTIFQLFSLAREHPELLSSGHSALLMPDLFGYFLTGKKVSEFSIASTTQLMNPYTKTWDTELMATLGIPADILPPIVPSGTTLGPISDEIKNDLGLGCVDVISVAGHDTASAIVAVPSTDEDFIYISCGTWSLFGMETTAPIINEKTEKYNLTNEGGYGGTTCFLKNIIGLWLIQETRRQYKREGLEYSYGDLEKLALAAEPFQFFIDPDAPEFVPAGNLPRRIREFCERTGQGSPQSIGEIVRCIYESIALKYRYTFEQLIDCTERTCKHIHMVGGGTKDNLLCQMAANATSVPIIAGPIEATALGNLAVQFIARGDIRDIWHARQIVLNSFEALHYAPVETAEWNDAFEKYKQFVAG